MVHSGNNEAHRREFRFRLLLYTPFGKVLWRWLILDMNDHVLGLCIGGKMPSWADAANAVDGLDSATVWVSSFSSPLYPDFMSDGHIDRDTLTPLEL